MAKKTAAGGKKKTVSRSPKIGTQPSGGGWNAGDRFNSKSTDNKKNDGKAAGQRIEKKRG